MAAEWIAPAVAGTVEATTGIFGALAGMRNTDQVNAINQMNANLSYQHHLDREKIEDERYKEETAYNRAWAEDERSYQRAFAEDERSYQRAFAENERAYQRAWAQQQQDYNRALQKQIFEREDTAISRQANELSKLGINPLSANMNGLGAGSVISSSPSGSSSYSGSSAPGSAVPSSSGRGNTSPAQLHYEQKLYDFSHIINAISSVAQGIDGAITGQYQRDALALQNDAQYLANLEKATDLGLFYNKPRRLSGNIRLGYYKPAEIDGYYPIAESFGWKSFNNWRQKSNSMHALNGNFFDTDDEKTKFIKYLANGDFIGIADNLINTLTKLGPKAKQIKDNFMDMFYPFK